MELLDLIGSAAQKAAKLTSVKTAAQPRPVIRPAVPVRIKDSKGGAFSCGFACEDITPDDLLSHTYWMAGYNIGKKITGFLDPLTINVMWLGCADGGIILASCDLVGLTGYELRDIRNSLADFCTQTGCKNITVSCTHTHAGIDTMGYWGMLPKTGKDKKFMEKVASTLKKLCYEAYANRRPGKLFYGRTEAPELIDRWREPYFTNDRLHRFRFVPDDGSTETWYINFGAHPNTLGGKNRLLSADYPCYMRREINREHPTNILFSVSSIGATDIGKVAENDLERTILGGHLLGRKALSITEETELSPEITVVSQPFVMPIDNIVLALANKIRIFNTRKCAADSSLGIGFVSEIDYFNIGGVEILTMPGEMFSELVYPGGYCTSETSSTGEPESICTKPLSEIFENDNLIIFGVTNDMAGYALAPNDFVLHETQPFVSRAKDRFGRGHYHETNSCGIKTAETIAKTCEMIRNSLMK